jgi:hypothetical protein
MDEEAQDNVVDADEGDGWIENSPPPPPTKLVIKRPFASPNPVVASPQIKKEKNFTTPKSGAAAASAQSSADSTDNSLRGGLQARMLHVSYPIVLTTSLFTFHSSRLTFVS